MPAEVDGKVIEFAKPGRAAPHRQAHEESACLSFFKSHVRNRSKTPGIPAKCEEEDLNLHAFATDCNTPQPLGFALARNAPPAMV
jgi:hypothetical protein